MSQKSSVPQAISFVSQVLKRDTALHESPLLYPNVVPQRQTTQGATRDRAQGRDLPRLFTHKKAPALRFGTGAPELIAEDPAQYDFSSEQVDKVIYNKDTNRAILRNLMENGIRDETGQLPGKSIIFAPDRISRHIAGTSHRTAGRAGWHAGDCAQSE